ncbi:MAG: aldehyde dehydrogenase family protein [Polyangiaceae bacterium]
MTDKPSQTESAALVTRAKAAQLAWAARSVEDRISALRPLAKRILEEADAIAEIVHREVKKPLAEALLAEVLPSADVVTYWCNVGFEHLEPMDVELDAISYPGKSGVITREPRGVVLAIMPWNFPVALPLRTIVPALLAGNAVLFKPSEVSPDSGKKIGELLKGLVPDDLFTVCTGDGSLGAELLQTDVDMVVFTGSVATGRKVAHACVDKLIPCALELGGKDAAIVLSDCDIERAANGVVWGALSNAGQNCGAVERVYVETSIAEAFTKRVTALVASLKESDVGPLATKAQFDVVARHVAAAKELGAKVETGGDPSEAADAKGPFRYPPTVLSLAKDEGPLMTEETFGPILPIVKVRDAEEAVILANASKFGLTASVWTKDIDRGKAIGHRLRAGVVTVNNHSFTGALPMTPWTGVGESGWGVTNSPFALDGLTRPRLLLVDKNRAKSELWWYPYTDVLTSIARTMAKFKGGVGLFGRIGALFTLLGLLPKRLSGK